MQPGAGRAGGAVGWGPWRRPHRACQDEQRLARHRGGVGEAFSEGVLRVQRPRPGGAASGHAGRPGAEGCAGRGGRLSWAWSSGAMHRARGFGLGPRVVPGGSGPGDDSANHVCGSVGPPSAMRKQRSDLSSAPGQSDQGPTWLGCGPAGRTWRRDGEGAAGQGRVAGMCRRRGCGLLGSPPVPGGWRGRRWSGRDSALHPHSNGVRWTQRRP